MSSFSKLFIELFEIELEIWPSTSFIIKSAIRCWNSLSNAKLWFLNILIELFYLRPLPFEAKLRNTYKVEDILDKGKDSILLVGVKSQDTRGRDMFYNQVLQMLNLQ